ncbi:hypothetical protein PybrP1_006793 [[Pythium] brassicae (nom. inval.)]|nr:hypothetical protein PybrP1_006793 [[Pythium] brassicae (nom. inval.)]
MLLWAAANSAWEREHADETLVWLRCLESVAPDDPMLPMALGAVFQHQNEWHAALEMYERALPQLSRNADLHCNMGQLFYHLKNMPRAVESYQRALALDAGVLPRIAHLLALAHHFNGDFALAEQFYGVVGEKTAPFHFDFAVTLERLGKIEQANREYNRALALDAHMADAWLNVAALHQQYGHVAEAVPLYLPATRFKAMTNLGVAFEVTEDVVAALAWFAKASAYIVNTASGSRDERAEALILVLTHSVRAKKTACEWEQSEEEFERLLQLALEFETRRGAPSALMPFDTLMHPLSARARKQIATTHTRQFSATRAGGIATPRERTARAGDSDVKLHVGYLSFDFTDHPTAHLLKGLFASSDRARTTVVAFSYGKDDGSAVRREVAALVDVFEDLANCSTAQSAATIRRHGIHVLMDAQVHARGSRMGIVAARPAPVVVNYLVYPGTSGAAFVDYLVTDRHVLPPELADGFTEKLAFLPHAYQVNAYDRAQSERAKLWRQRGATEPEARDAFVFVNFNKPDKIEPGVFAMWTAILRRVPGSVLLLLDPATPRERAPESVTSREIKRNLARAADAQGVHRSRIRFLPRVPKAEHLKRHDVNGLFLDTLVYGAHSTASDALYAGLPVLTLAGDSHASRVGVSLLSNLGMAELMAFSRKEYEELAGVHATLQRKLRGEALHHPLFQTPAHVQALETIQRAMYDLHVAGVSPHHIIAAGGR